MYFHRLNAIETYRLQHTEGSFTFPYTIDPFVNALIRAEWTVIQYCINNTNAYYSIIINPVNKWESRKQTYFTFPRADQIFVKNAFISSIYERVCNALLLTRCRGNSTWDQTLDSSQKKRLNHIRLFLQGIHLFVIKDTANFSSPFAEKGSLGGRLTMFV